MAIESEHTGYKVGLTTLVIAILLSAALLFNILLFFVYARSRIFRRPQNLFIVNLAVADVIGALFWAIPATVAASQWKWILGDSFCQFHGFAGILSFSLNMYTFTIIAFEKFLQIFAPARHVDVFRTYKITVMIACAVWIMSIVVAMLPLVGWGSFHFYSYLMQCDPDYIQNVSHLHFFFVNVYAIPFLASICFFVATFVKIAIMKKKASPTGEIVLQEKQSAAGESYADKVRKQEEKYQFAGLKTKDYSSEKKRRAKKKKQLKKKKEAEKKKEDDGYESNDTLSDDDSGREISDDELFFTNYEGFREYEKAKREKRRRKRMFMFKKRYLGTTIVMFIIWLVYVGLWGPYFFVNYAYAYDKKSGSEELFTMVALLTFGGISYKPLLYLINTRIRRSVKEAFQRRKKSRKIFKATSGGDEDYVVYSTREVHHTEVYEETRIGTASSSRPMTAWSGRSIPSTPYTPSRENTMQEGKDNSALSVEEM